MIEISVDEVSSKEALELEVNADDCWLGCISEVDAELVVSKSMLCAVQTDRNMINSACRIS